MKEPTILIVEDEQVLAFALKQQLEQLGYRVPIFVSTGKEALEQIKVSLPDLILMDIALSPEMDGIETAVQIQKLADIPIIYLTAYANKEILERAKLTYPFGYLIKPVKPKELHASIEMALNKVEEFHQLKENHPLLRQIDQYISHKVEQLLQGNQIMSQVVTGSLQDLTPRQKRNFPTHCQRLFGQRNGKETRNQPPYG